MEDQIIFEDGKNAVEYVVFEGLPRTSAGVVDAATEGTEICTEACWMSVQHRAEV